MDSPATTRALELLQQDLSLRFISQVTQIGRRILRRWRDGDFSVRKPGRPPLDESLRAEILQRIAERQSHRTIKSATGVSLDTISRIRRGRTAVKPLAKIKRGEQLLASPMRCPDGHLVTIWPCRQCKTMATIARFRALKKRAGL